MTARTALVPLFLVSLAAVGYETALTRYFAVAKWSEYGYWVISIVMVGLRVQRRGPGAVPRRLRAPRRDAAGGAAGAAGRHRGNRLPLHHDQPVQSAAIAESGDLGAAALEHRRLLRVPAAVLLSRRRIRQPELRAERGPHRPGLRLRPDRRGRRRGAGAGCDVRGARVLPGAAAAGAAGGQRLLRRGALALGGRRGGRCRAARRRGAAAARQPGGVQRLQGDLRAAAHARRARGRRPCCRRAATTRCWTTSPSASTPTSPTMPACWACPARRRPSGCIATATASPPCPSPVRSMSAMRRRRWTRCRIG